MNIRNGKRNALTVKTNNMFTNIVIGVIITILILSIFCAIRCKVLNKIRDKYDKIYEDELNKRRGDMSSFDDNTAF
jgi:hypothetical protein